MNDLEPGSTLAVSLVYHHGAAVTAAMQTALFGSDFSDRKGGDRVRPGSLRYFTRRFSNLFNPPQARGSGTITASACKRVTDIDWATWVPVDVGTLCFILREEEILLIRKKRGLGAGKIVGPGGRLEPGETILECAIRETIEEVGVVPEDPQPRGELRFQFRDGYSVHVHVFTSVDFVGEVSESLEALPLWTPRDAIPYDEMWEDDRIWIPWMLDGRAFEGRFVFDGDRMLDHESRIVP